MFDILWKVNTVLKNTNFTNSELKMILKIQLMQPLSRAKVSLPTSVTSSSLAFAQAVPVMGSLQT